MHTLYNVILQIGMNFLETRENIKRSKSSCPWVARSGQISGFYMTQRAVTFRICLIYDFVKPLKNFYFEILLAPSEIPASLPGQFSLSGQTFLHWALTTLKGLVEYQNKTILHHFSSSFLSQKCWFQDLRFYSIYSTSSRWCEQAFV